MKLSNKKIKYIKRNKLKLKTTEIANHLGIPEKSVIAAIKADTEKTQPNRNLLEKYSYFFFIAILFLSPLIFLNQLYEFENMPRSLLIQAGAILIPVMWGIQAVKRGNLSLLRNHIYLPVIVISLWALASIFWSSYKYGALSQWIHWVSCALILFISLNIHKNEKRILLTLHVIMITAAWNSILGISQYLIGLDWIPQQIQPAATFNNKNMAAQFIVLTFPISLIFVFISKQKGLTWLYAIVTAVIGSFLFYTGTKAAWISVIAELAFISLYFWFLRIKADRKIIPGLNRKMAIAFSFFVFLFFVNLTPEGLKWKLFEFPRYISSIVGLFPNDTEIFSSDLEEESIDTNTEINTTRIQHSAGIRFALWENTLHIIRQHPLRGIGIRNVQVYYPLTPNKKYANLNLHTQRTHNDYLQMYAELGFPVLVIWGWIVILILKGSFRLFNTDASDTLRFQALICLTAILGLAINAFFSFPFNRAMPPFLIAVFMGLFFRIIASESKQPENELFCKISYKASVATILILLIVFLNWAVISYRWAKADIEFKKHLLALVANQYKTSIAHGREALNYNPNRGAILRSLSRAYVLNGDYKNAEKLFRKIDKTFPNSPLNLYFQAIASINQNQYGRAEAILKKAVSIIPHSGKLYGLLGIVYQKQNRIEEAIEAYQKSIEFSPQISRHYEWLGELLYSNRQFEKAAYTFKDMLQIDPDNLNAHKGLGLALMQQNKFKEAEILFQEAVRIAPKSVLMHRYLGVALTRQNKIDKALLAFNTSLQLSNGRDSVSHNNLGSILARTGNIDKAISHFQKALEINPGYSEASANLTKALSLSKKPKN